MDNGIQAPSAAEFCLVLARARAFGLMGAWEGSAFRKHPCGVIRDGLILANCWHVDDLCFAEVILDPTSPIKLGWNDSLTHGDPYPHPERGGTLRVYWSGRWEAEDGPWRARILKVLGDLKAEIAVHEAAQREREERSRRAAEAMHKARVEAARAAMEASNG